MIFEHIIPITSIPIIAGAILVVAAGGSCTPSGLTQSGTLTPSDAASLKHAENVWVRSLTEGNAALLDPLIDEDFTFIGPDGQYEERAAYLAGYRALPSMGVKVESIDLHDVKYRVLEDTGIVTGRVVARIRMAQGELTEDVRFTRVYRRDGDGWTMIAGQGTRLLPSEPAALEPAR